MSTLTAWTTPVHLTQRELDDLQILADKGEIPADALAQQRDAEARNVFGHDAKKDRDGNYIEMGIGAKGNESKNHYDSILKSEREGFEPKGSYDKALSEIWRRDPDRAKSLRLPQPGKAVA